MCERYIVHMFGWLHRLDTEFSSRAFRSHTHTVIRFSCTRLCIAFRHSPLVRIHKTSWVHGDSDQYIIIWTNNKWTERTQQTSHWRRVSASDTMRVRHAPLMSRFSVGKVWHTILAGCSVFIVQESASSVFRLERMSLWIPTRYIAYHYILWYNNY